MTPEGTVKRWDTLNTAKGMSHTAEMSLKQKHKQRLSLFPSPKLDVFPPEIIDLSRDLHGGDSEPPASESPLVAMFYLTYVPVNGSAASVTRDGRTIS